MRSNCTLLLTIQFASLFFFLISFFFSTKILSGPYLWNRYSQRLQIECAAWSCGLILHCCLPSNSLRYFFFRHDFVRAISLEPLIAETPNWVCCLVLRSNFALLLTIQFALLISSLINIISLLLTTFDWTKVRRIAPRSHTGRPRTCLVLLSYSNCILVLFVPAWNIALISGVLPIILLFSIGLNQRLSAWLVIPPWPRPLTLCLFTARWLLYLFSTTIILSLLWWIDRLYSTSNGSAKFHTAGNICPQLLCGTLQCEN